MNETDCPASPSAAPFPTIPSPTLDRLFSIDNLRKIQRNSRPVNSDSLPSTDDSAPFASSSDTDLPVSNTADIQSPPLQHFESLLSTHLGGLAIAGSKVEYAREHMGKLYQLYYRVLHSGGYWHAQGTGLWEYFDKEIISGSKDMYENYLSYIDPELQKQAEWPLWRLKKTVVLPSFPLPVHPKPLRSLLSLPYFRLCSLPSILDLTAWCSSTLQMSVLSNPYEICSSEVEYEDGRIGFTYIHSGEVLVVQKGKVTLKCIGESEGKVKWLHGIIPNASRILALLETAISDPKLCRISLYSAVFDLLQADMSATLSLSSQAILAEKLLSEFADFPPSGSAAFSTVPASVCDLCRKSLFCLGRQCTCELVVCKRCRYVPHSCAEPSWSWVQVADFRDLRLVREALVSIQKRHLQSLRRN